MKLFPYAHATHPDWRMAAGLVLAQLRAQMALGGSSAASTYGGSSAASNHGGPADGASGLGYAADPTLGLLYITDHYAGAAQAILDHLSAELPEVTDWAGTVGVGIAANNVEYFDEPALALMLCELPSDQYRVFSGVAPLSSGPGLGFPAHAALVHADGATPDVAELIAELAGRTGSGYLFGGLVSSRTQPVQFAVGGNGNIKGQGAARGVFAGGLSGVAFAEGVALVSRVTQGCQPVGATRTVTACDGPLVTELDGASALDLLLADLSASLERPREALDKVRMTLVGLSSAGADALGRAGNFGADVTVRHIVGLDPARRGVAVASPVEPGMRLAFCQRDARAAKHDLMRICAEIREELEPQEELVPAGGDGSLAEAPPQARRIAGAVYVSCAGRGGPHFGAPSAELQIVRHALGDVPLVGFFAGGEIARHHVYGYTGVLTVFTT